MLPDTTPDGPRATSRSLFVVNPNSSVATTRSIEACVSVLDSREVPLRCVTLTDGPPGIESHEDFAAAEPLVERFVQARGHDAAGFVIACFSDPGVDAARSATDRPVIGIREASITRALGEGERFGIVALVAASVERQHASLARMDALDRLAACRPLGLSVAQLDDRDATWPRLLATAARLRDDDDAATIVLGCAGLGRYRATLEQAVGLPVIDPCLAGVAEALEHIAPGRGRGSPMSDPLPA